MADQQSPVPPPSSQQPQPSQTGSQEPPAPSTESSAPHNGQSEAPSEPTVAPKQEPDTAGPTADLDASIEQDIDMSGAGENITTNGEAAAGGAEGQEAVPTSVDALAAAAAPSKKETSLREFLGKMDEYAPIVSYLFLSLFQFYHDLLLKMSYLGCCKTWV